MEVLQHVGRDLSCARFDEQVATLLFLHRGVAAQDVVLLLEAGLVADHPISNHKISKFVARAPGVVSLVEHRLIEDEVDHRIRNVVDLVHGLALFLRQAIHDAPGDELGGGHNDRLGCHRL